MNIIKKARKEKGLTKREVAEFLDLPLLVYFYYECHMDDMSFQMRRDLYNYLDLKLNIFHL